MPCLQAGLLSLGGGSRGALALRTTARATTTAAALATTSTATTTTTTAAPGTFAVASTSAAAAGAAIPALRGRAIPAAAAAAPVPSASARKLARGRRENLDQRLGAVLLAGGAVLHVVGETIHGRVAVLGRLELRDLVVGAPAVDLDDLGLILLGKEIADLVIALCVHDEEADYVVRGVLGR